jgi:hypothetical protein
MATMGRFPSGLRELLRENVRPASSGVHVAEP